MKKFEIPEIEIEKIATEAISNGEVGFGSQFESEDG